MAGRDTTATASGVLQREATRLVVELKNAGIVLKFEHKGQFDSVALELDHSSHLLAGVASDNIRRPANDPPHWF
jgi:hypothetical protein